MINKKDMIEYSKLMILILLVIGLGLFMLNQAFKYFYGTKLLANPCGLCEELNIGTRCFDVEKYNDILLNKKEEKVIINWSFQSSE
jgi:hypothetical protein